jgi:RHS repeat-associated protein
MALTDDQGDVVGTYDYDVFGAVRSHSGTDTEFSFTGEQNDPNGLEYLRARYYDQDTGRFVSRDPLGWSPLWTQHNFAYVGGNATNLTDPLGLCLGITKGSCGSVAKNAVKAVANDFVENVSAAYYDVKAAAQVLDLVPLSPICAAGGAIVGGAVGAVAGGVGAIPGAIGGAAAGFGACEVVERVIGTASLYAGVTQALDSNCGLGRKLGAIGANAANFLVDITPLLDYAVEYPLYRLSTELLDCKE